MFIKVYGKPNTINVFEWWNCEKTKWKQVCACDLLSSLPIFVDDLLAFLKIRVIIKNHKKFVIDVSKKNSGGKHSEVCQRIIKIIQKAF